MLPAHRTFFALALAILVSAAAGTADGTSDAPVGGWLPEGCHPLLDLAAAKGETPEDESADARWNREYRRGYDAIEKRDLETAERSLCSALAAAQGFGPRDLRFAETLDELGLVHYLRGDDDRSEAMQGAAAAEILLALGPPADDLSEEERDHCRSSVANYLARLGWIFERQGRPEEIEPLQRAPYLVLDRGYVPARALAPRLDWLIARYLLAEDMPAADWLTGLRERLRDEADRR